MLNKEKLEKAMELLGELTQEQKALIAEAAEKKIPEKELYEKLGVDEKKFAEFLKAASDDAVFNQEVSLDELESVAGGITPDGCSELQFECRKTVVRYIKQLPGGYGFPNCAATVEDGSWCDTNDACWSASVQYGNMEECSKAWR